MLSRNERIKVPSRPSGLRPALYEFQSVCALHHIKIDPRWHTQRHGRRSAQRGRVDDAGRVERAAVAAFTTARADRARRRRLQCPAWQLRRWSLSALMVRGAMGFGQPASSSYQADEEPKWRFS